MLLLPPYYWSRRSKVCISYFNHGSFFFLTEISADDYSSPPPSSWVCCSSMLQRALCTPSWGSHTLPIIKIGIVVTCLRLSWSETVAGQVTADDICQMSGGGQGRCTYISYNSVTCHYMATSRVEANSWRLLVSLVKSCKFLQTRSKSWLYAWLLVAMCSPRRNNASLLLANLV